MDSRIKVDKYTGKKVLYPTKEECKAIKALQNEGQTITFSCIKVIPELADTNFKLAYGIEWDYFWFTF